ncbi:hemolysin D [Salinisphaera orenii MK-B5]|uniref:Hemolysin D n=1 Tax=Salinisphaera orenii MK-B5 TaxID=856730 RepID=A0A423PF80_9GAMM|nr:hemolysin D [Salinisphaera orenii MK-B5]
MLLLAAGCDARERATEAADAPVEVGVYAASAEPYTVRVTLPGRTVAYKQAAVRPQVDGIIRKRLFEQGARVEAGQPLYQIDPSRYEAAYARAKASLAQARAAVRSARSTADRLRALAEADAVSEQELEDALAALDVAQADVAAAKADLKTARINLDYARIEAPISGRIGASNVTEGALVTASQAEPLTTIRQLDPIYVDIRQSGRAYLQLKHALESGRLQTVSEDTARVRVSVVGDTGPPMRGRLEFSGVSVDPATATIELRAVVPNPHADLLPRMYVRAHLVEGIDTNAILVPQQGVLRTGRGDPYSLVVDDTDRVVRRPLTLAEAVGNRWRVIEGLAAGERVIVQGLGKVAAGDRVRPVPVARNGDPGYEAIEPSPADAPPAA